MAFLEINRSESMVRLYNYKPKEQARGRASLVFRCRTEYHKNNAVAVNHIMLNILCGTDVMLLLSCSDRISPKMQRWSYFQARQYDYLSIAASSRI
jgi:hypothetical protein